MSMGDFSEKLTRNELLEEVKDALEETYRGVGRGVVIEGDIGSGKTTLLKKIVEMGKERDFMVAYGQCTSLDEVYAPLLDAFSDVTYDELIGIERYSGFEHIFLIEKSGRLVSHSTSLSSWQMDEDIISGMLTAIQDFASTSFKLSEDASLGTLDFKDAKIIIEYGRKFFIAGVVRGDEHEGMRRDLSIVLNEFERRIGNKKWDGTQISMPEIDRMIQMTMAKKYRSVADLEGTSLTEEQRKIRTRFLDNITALTLKRPLLLVIDDFHSVDGPSANIFVEIAKITKDNRISLIVSYTPDQMGSPANYAVEKMLGNPNFIKLKIPPLTVEETGRLVKDEIGDVADDVVMAIHSVSRGNPYVIKEMAESIKMTDVKDKNEIISVIEKMRKSPDELFFDRKMEALNDKEMLILDYCAVADMPVTVDFIEKCIESQYIDLTIERLIERGYLEKTDGKYRIKHGMMKRKLYDTIPERWKRLMHGKVGLTLEEMSFERPDILAYRLAKHFTKAKMPAKAMRYLISAADFALSTYSLREAKNFLVTAEKMMVSVGPTKENLENKARIKEGLGDISLIETQYSKAIECYKSASESYVNVVDKARCMRKLAMIYVRLGKIDDAMKIINSEEKIIRGKDDYELGRVYLLKGNIYRITGKYDDAIACCTKAINLFKKGPIRKSDTSEAIYLVGSVYLSQKKLDKALSAYLEALEILSESKNYSSMARISHAVGRVYFLQNKYEKSEEWYSAALKLAKKIEDFHKIADIYSSMADLYAEKDEYDKAEYYLTKSEQMFASTGAKEGEAHIHRIKGKLYRERGRLKDAKDEFVKSVEMYRELKMPAEQVESLVELGLTLLEMGERKDGLLILKEARKMAKKLGKYDTVGLVNSILKSFK